ncbi:MAG: hypothetical protein DPW11_01395 [bacterium]|nr:hypothetical protein [Candidatus Microgenomates bacterium CPR3]MCQ3944416.1 hypothetical protein [bacterium]RIK52193.1 MAG: hypothetical protein DCC61_00190 [Candidatus Microgenomates bacterium]
MWFLYTLISIFLMALVLYTDEHLATSNKLPPGGNIHTKVGSVLLISTLMSFVGAALIGFTTADIHLTQFPLMLAITSAVPMVIMYGSYFYLLQLYPVHQVGPIFQISSVWLILFELLDGGTISSTGLIAIILLMYGAYILDAGTFKWKVPTKLLLIGIPVTSTAAIPLYMARVAARYGSATAFSFYQLLAIGFIGILILIFATKYREGFLYRIKHQGKKFLGLSLFNEAFAEGSFWLGNIAVALAPVGAYVSAMNGVQSLFVMMLLLMFPIGDRSKTTKSQWIAILLISVGAIMLG